MGIINFYVFVKVYRYTFMVGNSAIYIFASLLKKGLLTEEKFAPVGANCLKSNPNLEGGTNSF